ncbi:MAG TPA: transposase family protein [Methylomirabilota bacterium]|nr:transposase family protein [Methylomirabilota bacterium]
MTRASLREYAGVQRERYRQATRAEKRQLLDEVVAVTGIHRKAAIRLLRRAPRPRAMPGPGGRPREYGPEVAAAAEVLWQASGRIGAHRLHPFVPDLLERLVQCGEVTVAPDVEKLLRQASRPTLARLLAPARAQYPPRGATTTRPGTWLKHEIPIRTFTEWDDARPGFCEVDLVAHCGTSTQGFYLCTLCAVDIATAWVELDAVWGKGQQRVGTAVHQLRARLPVPLVGLDSDNGSEFINQHLYAWCQREGITFTRSRAWKKNDSAHVEQKNGAVVRQLVGYDRFASKTAYGQLMRVYRLARLHVNFFQPVQKLVTKTRQGARAHRVYDRAQTPYQRLCAAGVLPAAKRDELERLYQSLNPLQLRRDLEAALDRLWALAAPDPRRPQRDTEIATPSLKSSPGGS